MGLSLERWQSLMERMGLPECAQTFNSLLRTYSSPDRHYHTDQHILDCLTLYDEVRDQLRHPEDVEAAIWFHDSVYNPVAPDNERESAEGARNFLVGQGATKEVGERVYALIVATDHDHVIKNRDMAYLVDIDLSVLGAGSERYAEYEAAITKEFRLIPEFVFHTKRSQFLRKLLAQEHLYHTDYFRERFESNARANIAQTLEDLTV